MLSLTLWSGAGRSSRLYSWATHFQQGMPAAVQIADVHTRSYWGSIRARGRGLAGWVGQELGCLIWGWARLQNGTCEAWIWVHWPLLPWPDPWALRSANWNWKAGRCWACLSVLLLCKMPQVVKYGLKRLKMTHRPRGLPKGKPRGLSCQGIIPISYMTLLQWGVFCLGF